MNTTEFLKAERRIGRIVAAAVKAGRPLTEDEIQRCIRIKETPGRRTS